MVFWWCCDGLCQGDASWWSEGVMLVFGHLYFLILVLFLLLWWFVFAPWWWCIDACSTSMSRQNNYTFWLHIKYAQTKIWFNLAYLCEQILFQPLLLDFFYHNFPCVYDEFSLWNSSLFSFLIFCGKYKGTQGKSNHPMLRFSTKPSHLRNIASPPT